MTDTMLNGTTITIHAHPGTLTGHTGVPAYEPMPHDPKTDAEIVALLRAADDGCAPFEWAVPWEPGEHGPTLETGGARITIFADGCGYEWDYVDRVTFADGREVDVDPNAHPLSFDWVARGYVWHAPGGPAHLPETTRPRRRVSPEAAAIHAVSSLARMFEAVGRGAYAEATEHAAEAACWGAVRDAVPVRPVMPGETENWHAPDAALIDTAAALSRDLAAIERTAHPLAGDDT